MAFVAHSEHELQSLMDRFSLACEEFNLTISLKKTTVMGQNTPAPPTLGNYNLEVIEKFCYLGSTVTNTLSLDAELNIRIGKASTTFGMLTKRVWRNSKLTITTKVYVYICTWHAFSALCYMAASLGHPTRNKRGDLTHFIFISFVASLTSLGWTRSQTSKS